MNGVKLITVPHTGTMFFEQLFVGRDPFGRMHCRLDNALMIEHFRAKIVTTIRDPLAVVCTHYDRNQLDWDKLEGAYLCWYGIVMPRAVAVLSVDHDCEGRLQRCADVLQTPRSIDWQPVNVTLGRREAKSLMDAGQITELFELIDGDRFRRLYDLIGQRMPEQYGWWRNNL